MICPISECCSNMSMICGQGTIYIIYVYLEINSYTLFKFFFTSAWKFIVNFFYAKNCWMLLWMCIIYKWSRVFVFFFYPFSGYYCFTKFTFLIYCWFLTYYFCFIQFFMCLLYMEVKLAQYIFILFISFLLYHALNVCLFYSL